MAKMGTLALMLGCACVCTPKDALSLAAADEATCRIQLWDSGRAGNCPAHPPTTHLPSLESWLGLDTKKDLFLSALIAVMIKCLPMKHMFAQGEAARASVILDGREQHGPDHGMSITPQENNRLSYFLGHLRYPNSFFVSISQPTTCL